MMENEYSMIIAAFADKESAKNVAGLLVEKRLAACAQMIPVESVYLWRDSICRDNEIILFAKSKTALFGEIAAAIKENHTYEIPEIIQVPITEGLPEYLLWIDECVRRRD